MTMQQRMVELIDANRDSMVRVHAAYASRKEGEPAQETIGSGFFISRQGLVLTNASIVNQADRVWVEHGGVDYSAELVGDDRPSNIALLRLDSVPEHFGFFHLTDSPDLPTVGQMVLRLSMPLRFDPSPRMGLVAGFESEFGAQLFPCKYIRVNMGAGPGEGGAAYIDFSGRLVGIQVFSLPEIDSSYVLPTRAALRIRDDLLFSGEVSFGWMGFQIKEVTSVADGRRLVIESVDENSPAEDAGLLSRDLIVRIGAYGIRGIDDLRNAMFYSRVGQFVEIAVRRDGEPHVVSLKLAKRTEPLQVVRSIPRTTEAIPPVNSVDPETEEPSNPLLPETSIIPPAEVRNDVPVSGGK